jgi:hypothetical protein
MLQNYNKIFFSLVILIVFYILYLTIPDNEFIRTNSENDNIKINIIHFTIKNHTGLALGNRLIPISTRARLLSMVHGLMSFFLLLY